MNIKGGVNFSTSEAPELYYDDTADLFERLQSVEPTWNPYLPDGSPNYGYGKRDGNPFLSSTYKCNFLGADNKQ